MYKDELMQKGLLKELVMIVFHYADITYCKDHNIYFPFTLKTCLLCFNQKMDFYNSESWLFYTLKSKIVTSFDGCVVNLGDYLFEEHLRCYIKEKNPNVVDLKREENNINCTYFAFGNLHGDLPFMFITHETDFNNFTEQVISGDRTSHGKIESSFLNYWYKN